MSTRNHHRQRLEHGFAMLTATIFVVVLLLAGLAFFSLVSYETKAAIYRDSSSESFYLADGAVERARAKFLEDRTWRDGWTSVTLGRGEYDLAVEDTIYLGEEAVRLLASGRVHDAERRVEVMVDLPPTAFDLTLLIMGDVDVNGNLCLDSGSAHVNGDPDFGPQDRHLVCGEYTSGFEILPPPIYTDPDHFPDATYYFVRGDTTGGFIHAKIFDRDGIDITSALNDSLDGLVSWDHTDSSYTFDFHGDDVENYFNDESGVFKRLEGDVSAVVNFGEPMGISPNIISHVILDDDASISTTVVNTRFTGITEDDRLDDDYWYGGMVELQHIIMEPRYGIALIPYDLERTGTALVQIGTDEWPALVYVTNDVPRINANMDLVGSIIVLGDFGVPHITGGPDFIYDDGFVENFPDYLVEEWVEGTSGTMKILRWREVASANP